MATQQKKPATRKQNKSSGLSSRQKNRMPAGSFAFPKERKEPLNDARHVRNAVARFDQVEGVSDRDRDAAWRRIRAAAKKYGVELQETSWRELTRDGKTRKPAAKRRRASAAR